MLLIITPSQFSSVLQPLKQHKEKTGILTSIITLEKVYQDYDGRDEAEQVKRCIADYHAQQGIRFVLLAGDSDRFPVRYTKTDRNTDAAFDTAFYPTDLYYAALYKADGSFDDWDWNGNGYFGELNGETHSGPINIDKVSLHPVVAVGRIPASTTEDVTRYVNKVINYETKAYQAAWAEKALLLATHDWLDDACNAANRIHDYLSQYDCTRLYSEGCSCEGDEVLTALKVTQKMNSGVGLVSYIGHGGTGNLGIPGGYWDSGDISQLTNKDCLPIMCVSACSTAVFAPLPPYSGYTDIDGVNHAGTSAGEVFTSTPPQPACLQSVNDPDGDLASSLTVGTENGVIAYMGGVTGMQFYYPTEYFFKCLQQRATVGEAWQAMVDMYYEEQGQPGSLGAPNWGELARMHQPWKTMLFGDPSLRIGGAVSGEWSRQQITRTDRGTSKAPALQTFYTKLYMAWKGKGDDPKIWFSSFDGERWSPQKITNGDRGTSDAPALAVFGNRLYMAWKGKGDDPKIYFSYYDEYTWSPQQLTNGDRGTSHAPALAAFDDKLYMAWKGKGSDPKIYFSYYDGTSWSPQQLTSGDRGTSDAPALEVFRDKLYMVWKGKENDPKIWYSVFDGASWTPQKLTSGDRGTSNAPTLAVYRDKLYMAWKGKESDPKIWFSTFDGTSWSPQRISNTDRGTSDAPALGYFHTGVLFMAWKGKGTDPKIWFSYLFEPLEKQYLKRSQAELKGK